MSFSRFPKRKVPYSLQLENRQVRGIKIKCNQNPLSYVYRAEFANIIIFGGKLSRTTIMMTHATCIYIMPKALVLFLKLHSNGKTLY